MKCSYLFIGLGIFLLSILFSTKIYAERLDHRFPVSTTINKAELYPYSLTIKAVPNNLALTFNDDTRKFNNASTLLVIESTIPEIEMSLGFGYNLLLLANTSVCRNAVDQQITQEDFMSLEIDNILFDFTHPVMNNELIDVNAQGELVADNQLTLISDEINNIIQHCNGSVIVGAELTL